MKTIELQDLKNVMMAPAACATLGNPDGGMCAMGKANFLYHEDYNHPGFQLRSFWDIVEMNNLDESGESTHLWEETFGIEHKQWKRHQRATVMAIRLYEESEKFKLSPEASEYLAGLEESLTAQPVEEETKFCSPTW